MSFLDMVSSIITERIYVVDVKDYGWEKDYYKIIVHPDDLSLWTNMRKTVLRYLEDFEEKHDEIDYFSFTFRLQRNYSFLTHPLPQMVFHRMKPAWEDDELRFFVCSIGSSTAKVAGHLRMYYKDGLTYEEYDTKYYRWKKKTLKPFSERERAILMLAQQNNGSKEIANILCKGNYTIKNQIKQIFSKLDVHSIQEAIERASFQHLIFPILDLQPQLVKEHCKTTRVYLRAEMLTRIQHHLDDGKSIRYAAKLEGVTEGAVRYSIKKFKLRIVKKKRTE